MSTALQISTFGGALIGLGLTILLARLAPARVDPRWAIDRLDPTREGVAVAATGSQRISGLQNRLGLAIQRRGPAGLIDHAPRAELAMLQRPLHVYYGEKALLFVVGLAFPPVATLFFGALGLSLPFVLPAAGSLALAVVLWFAPDLRLRSEAREARGDFVLALATYIDLVALERITGSGTTQALKVPAENADSWVFKRINEALTQADLSGANPWDALKDLGEQLKVPELTELGEIMRLAREESAAVYTQLRARATSLRNSLLATELAKANAAGEQQSVPVAFLLLTFVAILGVPAILRIL